MLMITVDGGGAVDIEWAVTQRNYRLVVERYHDEQTALQKDVTVGLTVLEAAAYKENLVAVYKADGYTPVNDLDLVKPGIQGWVRLYIAAESRQ